MVSWIFAAFTFCAGLIVGYLASVLARSRTASTAPELSATEFVQQLTPLSTGLDYLQSRLTQLEHRQADGLATLREQLRQSQITDRLILEATQDLDSALRQAPKRGTWGEASLQRVLEASGLSNHIDYTLQSRHGDGAARPDAVIHLPANAHLVIDAKVPLDAYLQAHENDEHSYQLMRQHAQALRNHVRALAGRNYTRYVEGAVDTVVMYLPSEALVSASFDADPQIFEDALRRGIVVVGPAGLMALLRSVGSLWARQNLDEDAAAIIELGHTLVERMEVLSRHLQKLGSALNSSVEAYNGAVGSFEQRLAASARSVTALALKVPDPLAPIDTRARDLRGTTIPEEHSDPGAPGHRQAP